MSWKDRLENKKLTITTGDGKIYTPLWIFSEKSKEFNISKYDFINQSGSFVDRKEPQGSSFPLTLYFQGEDNIDQAQAFEDSAEDKRLWTIEHPFYGTIKGQPNDFKRDDSSYNVTVITISFWESIDGEFPESEISIEDEVKSKADSVNKTAAAFLVENSVPETADIPKILQLISKAGAKFKANKAKFNEYKNIVNKAAKVANNIVYNVVEAAAAIQDVINFPANFATSVSSRVNSYVGVYNDLKDSIDNVFSKYNFESQAASVFAGIAVSAVTNTEESYITRTDIENINNILVNLYDDYLETLDNNQVTIYDIEESWTPNLQIQLEILALISFTSTALYQLSFDARQERTVELTKDTNLIILTHRFLGLDALDENIDTFRKINNIKNEELYKIKQGRTIKYFV